MSPQVLAALQNFPAVVQFMIVMGSLAAAFLAMRTAWSFLRPDPTPAIEKAAAVNAKDVEALRAQLKLLRDEFLKSIEKMDGDFRKTADRVNGVERQLATIDISQINRRFDRIEAKLDDLYNLLMDRAKAKFLAERS